MIITPRDYQQAAIDASKEATLRGINRQLLVLATGMGKTILSSFMINEAVKMGKRPLVLIDRKVLATDWRDELLSINPNLNVGIEMNTSKAGKQNDVVVASLQTLGRKNSKRIKKFNPDEFDWVFSDEAHHFPTPQGIRVLEYFGVGHENFNPDKTLVGLTATPERTDGVSLGYLFDDVVAEYPIGYGIRNGWLTDMLVHRIKTDTDISKVKKSKDDYNQKQLGEAVNNERRNKQVINAYLEYLNGEKAIVYSVDVEHAYALQVEFKNIGIRSEVIEAHTTDEDRARWIKEFREGDLNILLNFGTLTTGFNATEVKGLILTRPIRSKTLLTQILGRGLRPSKDSFIDVFTDADGRLQSIASSTKPECLIIDFEDIVHEKNILTQASLFGTSPKLNISGKRLFKEVIEPLEELQKEKGVDISQIESMDDIKIISEKRRLDIGSLKTPPEIEELSKRTWISAGEGIYEILYSDQKKALIVERNKTKSQLLDKEEWNLLEYDTKSGVTKKLQMFNNLSAAIKNADEYADRSGWESTFKEKAPWMDKGVSEGQWNLLMKLYRYKSGYCEFRILNSRYSDTGTRKLVHKKTKEVLDAGLASKYIDQKLGK